MQGKKKLSDFMIDEKHTIEVGGKNKDRHQIRGKSQAYLAVDDIEQGAQYKIPLWLFGFLV